MPGIESGRIRVAAELLEESASVWEPVGTPGEYLAVNLSPPSLPSLGGQPERWSGDVRVVGSHADVILGSKAEIGAGARLERAVVWECESVPAGLAAHDGVFAAGRFHGCQDEPGEARSIS